MKILFVASGNKAGKPGAVVKNQADSLQSSGISIDFFLVKEKGLLGYIKAGVKLGSFLKNNHYDIIHAHYTLSGWSAVIGSGKLPVILSLMGSDTYGDIIAPNKAAFKSKYLTLLTYLIQPCVKKLISKSPNIEKFVWQKKKSVIIPNGIDTEKFKPSEVLKKDLGLNEKKKHVLFLGDRNSIRKNYQLVKKAFNYLKNQNVELLNPYPVSHEQIPKYLNAVDLLIHPSLAEGSPNLVKEAMACNCPVVSTDVGDIRWLFGNESGHYICDFDPQDVSAKIEQALSFIEKNDRTNGRSRIIELGLDATSIAEKLKCIYAEVFGKK
jgi:glycosyltransferase involved in cell wall biosynthesis